MEGGALVSVATGALQSVVEKLTSLLGEEYRRLKGIRSEIEWLTCELEAMKAFLVNMSTKAEDDPHHDDEQDKIWMKHVRELSYDIEDSLDDFFARHASAVGGAKPDRFMEKIRSLLERTKSRHRIAKEIQHLKTKVIEVAERNKRYSRAAGDPAPAVQRSTVDPRALVIFEDARNLVGIDGPKGEVIRLLEQQKEEQQQPKIIVSIVGSGGLGKTTLAHQVYQQLKNQFKYRAFLSVSRNPDINGTLRKIIYDVVTPKDYESATKGDYYVTKVAGTEQLITIIRKYLESKRYFIVLDDIWETETWQTIKNIFPMTQTYCGSKIIITTRINQVAWECCPSTNGRIYNIRPLNMAHSTQLFYRRLFNPEEKCPPHLQEISYKILEKCAGLPLAIIAISGLLSSKEKTWKEWDQVNTSIGHSLERNSSVEEMLKILSLSYFDLPPHLRTCLLYLSIFPEDYTIEKDSLIRRWISEGFIHEQNQLEAYNAGERCFNDLIDRSLIQPGYRDEFDEVKSCRVHDTVLEFIVSKAIEENFVTLVGVPGVNPVAGSKVRRLSVQNDAEIPTGLVLSTIRSLNVFGGKVAIPSLSELRLLRVLAFEDCGQLQGDDHTGVSDLLHLRYLRLKEANAVTDLSIETAELHYMDTGKHAHFGPIMEIPENICQAGRLEWLVTLVAHSNVILPNEIGDMKALRVLEGVNIDIQSVAFIEGLGELTNLRKLGLIYDCFDIVELGFISDNSDRLMLVNLDSDEERFEQIAASMHKLTESKLDSLHIKTLGASTNYHSIMGGEILNRLSKKIGDTHGLRELVIEGWDHIEPDLADLWPLLVNLQKLLIGTYYYGLSKNALKTLGRISGLEYLCIELYDFESKYPDEIKAPIEGAIRAHPNRPKLVWIEGH